MSAPVHTATVVAALGCGLLAGVWFAFSGFVMSALERLPSAQGIAAMQSINRLAVTPPLMIAMFGVAVLCLGLAGWAAVSLGDRRAAWVLAGGALYLVGTVGVTMAGNVPLNDSLAALAPDGAGAAQEWERYTSRWTALNHVRCVTALAAAALLTVALTRD